MFGPGMNSAMLAKQGAEALIRPVDWHGRSAVEKVRLPKGYRHPLLDEALRSSRVRAEARLMAEARATGVPVPIIYDVDLVENRIVMARLEGPTAKEVLQAGGPEAGALVRTLGEMVGRLHAADIVHGDLTTSNMIWLDDRLFFIDFGLGQRSTLAEDLGVDLHLLREAFASAHPTRMDLFEGVLEAYRAANPRAGEVLIRMKAIEGRGRYLRGS